MSRHEPEPELPEDDHEDQSITGGPEDTFVAHADDDSDEVEDDDA